MERNEKKKEIKTKEKQENKKLIEIVNVRRNDVRNVVPKVRVKESVG